MRLSNWFPDLAIMEMTLGNDYLDPPKISPLLWVTPCYCPAELQFAQLLQFLFKYESNVSVPSVGNFTVGYVFWPLDHLANILYLFVKFSCS